jgi:hypothetical protein
MTDADRTLATELIAERFLPLLAHVILFALLLILMWGPVPRPLLAAWGGAVVGVSLIRVMLWDLARRRNLPARTITRMARVTMLALGLAWGGGAAFAFIHLTSATAALIILGLTGLIAGGLATLVADRWVFPIYAIAMFLPPVVVLALIEPGLFDDVGVVLMAIFLAFSLRLHARAHDSLRQRLRAEENQRTLLRELQASVAEVKVLTGILPICASCKRIRADGGKWEAVESYVRDHTNAEFSHGLCPDCAKRDWCAGAS